MKIQEFETLRRLEKEKRMSVYYVSYEIRIKDGIDKGKVVAYGHRLFEREMPSDLNSGFNMTQDFLNDLWKEVRTADKEVFIISISKLN